MSIKFDTRRFFEALNKNLESKLKKLKMADPNPTQNFEKFNILADVNKI